MINCITSCSTSIRDENFNLDTLQDVSIRNDTRKALVMKTNSSHTFRLNIPKTDSWLKLSYGILETNVTYRNVTKNNVRFLVHIKNGKEKTKIIERSLYPLKNHTDTLKWHELEYSLKGIQGKRNRSSISNPRIIKATKKQNDMYFLPAQHNRRKKILERTQHHINIFRYLKSG